MPLRGGCWAFGFFFNAGFQWRCSSFWRRASAAQRSRWAELLSAGWATAWRWEDASSSLSLLFHLLFSQSVAACLSICNVSRLCSAGEEFSPHGTRRHGRSTNLRQQPTLLWLQLWIISFPRVQRWCLDPKKTLFTPALRRFLAHAAVEDRFL